MNTLLPCCMTFDMKISCMTLDMKLISGILTLMFDIKMPSVHSNLAACHLV